jgi:hypothetical protein
VPKHHKAIVGIDPNPGRFEDLKEELKAGLADFDETAEITEFVVDRKHGLAVLTIRTSGSKTFEDVAHLIHDRGYEPFEIGPINLDDAPEEPASAR